MSAISPNNRYDSLDALRGLSIFGMLWSGLIPFGVLPAFMYHIQVPPPEHVFNPNLPGISWVDLVFPAFIFCMGVAIPLAFHAKIKMGATTSDLIKSILKRYLLLVIFAWVVGIAKGISINLTSAEASFYWIKNVDLQLLSLSAAILLHIILGTWSRKKFPAKSRLIKTLGWLGLVLWFVTLKFKYNSSFGINQVDIILLILANVYLLGGFGWLITKRHWGLELGLFTFWGGIQFFLKTQDISQYLDHIPFLFRPDMLHYMILLVPAIYIGNKMLKVKFEKPNIASIKMNPKIAPWTPSSKVVSYGLFLISGLFVFTFYLRLPVYWPLSLWGICASSFFLIKSFWKQPWELHALVLGMVLLLAGIVLDGILLEGGIKKDHVTVSYLLATAGLSSFLLLAFEALSLKFNKGVLVWNGHNPLMAYVAVALVAFPIMELTNLKVIYAIDFWIFEENAWFDVFKAFFLTYIVMSMVRYLTKFHNQYWKV